MVTAVSAGHTPTVPVLTLPARKTLLTPQPLRPPEIKRPSGINPGRASEPYRRTELYAGWPLERRRTRADALTAQPPQILRKNHKIIPMSENGEQRADAGLW